MNLPTGWKKKDVSNACHCFLASHTDQDSFIEVIIDLVTATVKSQVCNCI